jgi:transposase
MTYIRKIKTASGATAVQIVRKEKGEISALYHIGSAHNPEELSLLMELASKKLHDGQLDLSKEDTNLLKVGIKRTFSAILIEQLRSQYRELGFDRLNDEVFELLCLARIVEPTSKIDSLRVLEDLGIERFDHNKLYRSLAKVEELDYRTQISQDCFKKVRQTGLTLLLYDVTTLYFEAEQEDEYRKSGLSKERRLEPQIIIGLLVDQKGFPLELQSFEGNKAETKTILPVIEAFQARYGLTEITVVADAAMLSAENLSALSEAGCTYVVGSRLQKIPYDLLEYQRTQMMADQQIFTIDQGENRVIYQYRVKRAVLDLRNIEKQITKAERALSGQVTVTRTKFLKISGAHKQLDQDLIDKHRKMAGIKAYVTNLSISDQEVIDYYHQLFRVESSFRMAKSDLRARPVYHRKRDAIEAHLTIVLADMAISKEIEAKTGLSNKQFVNLLRPLRSAIVNFNSKGLLVAPEIPPSIRDMLLTLSPGH